MYHRRDIVTSFNYIDELFDGMAQGYSVPKKGTNSNYVFNSSGKYIEYEDPPETLLKWDKIDDRLNTMYGSTYEVPIEDFRKVYTKEKIVIFGDRYLLTDWVMHTEHLLLKWESTANSTRIVQNKYVNSLYDILVATFPNSVVERIGDFSYSATELCDLSKVYQYLTTVEVLPTYFVFNGIEKTILDSGGTQAKQLLSSISYFCRDNNIKAMVVYTPNLDILEDSVYAQYQDVQSYIYNYQQPSVSFGEYVESPKLLEFNLAAWISSHWVMFEEDKYDAVPDRVTDVLDEEILGKYIYGMPVHHTERYIDIIYNIIKRKVLHELFGFKRKCFYITMVCKQVQKGFYGAYHGTHAKHTKWEDRYKSNGAPVEGIATTDECLPPHHVAYRGKYFDDGQPWDLFKNTGEFFAISLSTEYSDDCFIGEQVNATCFAEWHKRRTDLSGYVNDSELGNLMKIRKTIAAHGAEMRTPAAQLIPSGCPWFTRSGDNGSRYLQKVGRFCPIHVYINRGNYDCTITIRMHTELGFPDLYQSISFGKMEGMQFDQFDMPLYVGGGSTGLANDVYSFDPVNGTRTFIAGNVYDLDMNNICLSNSNILHPTKFNGADFSNFKILTKNNGWVSIFRHEQTASVVPWFNCAVPPDHMTHLNPPTHNLGNMYDYGFPSTTALEKKIGSRYFKHRGWNNTKGKEPLHYQDNPEIHETSLHPLRVFYSPVKDNKYHYGEYGAIGYIPHVFWTFDWEIPSGEFIQNGKRYLAVPCVWDNRLWYYGYHVNVCNDEWDTLVTVENYEAQRQVYGDAQIKDKLIIELGDA